MNYWGLNCYTNKGQQLIGVPNDCSCVENEQVTTDQWEIVSIEYMTDFNCELKVYPNPTTGKIIIHLAEVHAKCTVSISSINGKTVLFNQYRNSDKIILDLKFCKPGLYIIKLDMGKEKTGKIIIKK